jgi:hypothetical protein
LEKRTATGKKPVSQRSKPVAGLIDAETSKNEQQRERGQSVSQSVRDPNQLQVLSTLRLRKMNSNGKEASQSVSQSVSQTSKCKQSAYNRALSVVQVIMTEFRGIASEQGRTMDITKLSYIS